MLAVTLDLPQFAHLIILLVGVGLLYVASRSAVDALVPADAASPGLRAIAHHLPLAGVAVAGVAMNQPALAVGTLFGTAVASLALACGAMILSAEHRIDAPARFRRTWPFVLVVAAMALLAGFSARFTLTHAAFFLVEGVVLALLWNAPMSDDGLPVGAAAQPRHPVSPAFLVLSLLLVIVGSWAVARGAVDLSRNARGVTLGTIAATMVAPMLVLPTLGTGVNLVGRNLGGAAVTTQIGIALLSLCLWMPVVVGGQYAREYFAGQTSPIGTATQPTTQPATGPSAADETPPAFAEPHVAFPIVVWRVDTVVLLLLGLILLPAAVGRWPLARRDGLLMLLIYVAYLMVTAALGRR